MKRRLSNLLLDGSGQFNHLVWQTSPTFHSESLRDTLASLHEWAHHELNNVSSFGLVLSFFAFAAMHADQDNEVYRERLLQLVNRSEITHEVYATWYSVELLKVRSVESGILSLLPSDYRRFYEQGELLVAEIESPFVRQQVFLSALRSCLESTSFANFDFSNAKHFELSLVRSKDFPDSRLDFLAQSMQSGQLRRWSMEFQSSEADEFTKEQIETASKRTASEGFFDSAIADEEIVTRRYLNFLSDKLRKWFDENNRLTGEPDVHLRVAARMVDALNEICRNYLGSQNLSVTADPFDPVSVLLRQMESEVVSLREKPIPATIVGVGELSPQTVNHLSLGTPRHLLFHARTWGNLLPHHELKSELGEFDLNDSVVFLRNQDTGQEGLEVIVSVFDSPEQVRMVLSANPDAMRIGLVSSRLISQRIWKEKWTIEDIVWVTKIDHSITDFLLGLSRTREEVLYSIGKLNSGDQVFPMLMFLARSKNESQWEFYWTMSSPHLAKSCVQFIEQRMPASIFKKEERPFQEELNDLISIIASHLIRDEFFLSINQVEFR